jgi:hypothetical protein
MGLSPAEAGDPVGFAFWLRFWCRIIAALQIIGGLSGLYGVLFGGFVGPSRVILLVAFLLFAASLCGGVLLALGRPSGVSVSLVVQALQVLQITTVGVVYSFTSGLQMLLGLRLSENGPDLGLHFYLPAQFFVFIDPPPSMVPQGAFLGVNIAAILAIICLRYVRAARLQSPLTIPKAGPSTENI